MLYAHFVAIFLLLFRSLFVDCLQMTDTFVGIGHESSNFFWFDHSEVVLETVVSGEGSVSISANNSSLAIYSMSVERLDVLPLVSVDMCIFVIEDVALPSWGGVTIVKNRNSRGVFRNLQIELISRTF